MDAEEAQLAHAVWVLDDHFLRRPLSPWSWEMFRQHPMWREAVRKFLGRVGLTDEIKAELAFHLLYEGDDA